MAEPAPGRAPDRLLLSEVYATIQGESSLVGHPTVFVRLYSCNLRCAWCDSMHAVEGGGYEEVAADELARRVRALAVGGIRHVCWTGGEPLLQWRLIVRAVRLLPDRFVHSIETDGEVPIEPLAVELGDLRGKGLVRFILDVKCPGSGMTAKLAYENLRHLRPEDEVKFVLVDRVDYEFARGVLRDHAIPAGTVLLSPANPAHKVKSGLTAADLAAWILDDGLDVRLQIQVHKVIWPGKERGV